MQKQPLLGRTLHELQDVVKSLGMPGFAAKQIAMWLYDKKVAAIDEMTNLSLKHRELLNICIGWGRTTLWSRSISRRRTGLRCVCPHKWGAR